jgi:methylated-DNA-[protein]-cysteine S-methyltransferase
LNDAIAQLQAYFQGTLQQFTMPLLAEGTVFQQAVWDALQRIPYGQTCSYQAIAERIGNPKAVRAVGMANGRNPSCIFIPCHRVIYASQKMGGYSGGLQYKVGLLTLEAGHAEAAAAASDASGF